MDEWTGVKESLKSNEEDIIARTEKVIKNSSHFQEIINTHRNDVKNFFGENIFIQYKELFVDKYPTYYRIESGKLCKYPFRSENPVIVFLDNRLDEEQFINYFGINCKEFLYFVKYGEIIPFCDHWQQYEASAFYKSLFSKWFRELDDKPPLYGNVIERVLQNSHQFWQNWQNQINELFGHYSNIGIRPGTGLMKQDFSRYFAERLTWLDFCNLKPITKLIWKILKRYKKSKDKEMLTLAKNLTFYSHQILSSKYFYSMGSVVTISVHDYYKIIRYLNALTNYLEHTSKLRDLIIDLITFKDSLTMLNLCNIAEKTEKPLVKLPKEQSPNTLMKIYHKCKKNRNWVTYRRELTKYENNYYKTSEIHKLIKSGGIEKANKLRDNLCNSCNNLRESYLENRLRKYEWTDQAMEYVETFPFSKIPMIHNTGPILQMGVQKLHELIKQQKINKESELFDKEIIFIPTQMVVWEVGKSIGCKKRFFV